VTFNVTAVHLAFSVSRLSARAGATVTVNFTNIDTAVQHDLSFAIPGLPHGNTCPGPCTDSYNFTAPAPGNYAFFCTVHAEMVGNFAVTP
jgi:plastocyanin